MGSSGIKAAVQRERQGDRAVVGWRHHGCQVTGGHAEDGEGAGQGDGEEGYDVKCLRRVIFEKQPVSVPLWRRKDLLVLLVILVCLLLLVVAALLRRLLLLFDGLVDGSALVLLLLHHLVKLLLAELLGH